MFDENISNATLRLRRKAILKEFHQEIIAFSQEILSTLERQSLDKPALLKLLGDIDMLQDMQKTFYSQIKFKQKIKKIPYKRGFLSFKYKKAA